jgi:membrane protein required for colicin V production
MINAQLNYFDMAVLGVMLLSCLFAFFRGFVKEILSLLGWIAAGAVTLYFFKPVAETLRPNFSNEKVAAISAILLLYFGSLIVFSIFNRIIIKILKSGSGIGWFDNFLGLGFGALRGALIISLAYFLLSLAIAENNRPDWLQNAKTRPYVEKGAMMLAKIAPQYLDDLSSLQNKAKIEVQNTSGYMDRANIPSIDSTVVTNIGNEVKESGKEGAGNFEQFLKDLGKKQ